MSSSALQLAKDQLNSLSKFQRDMHVLDKHDRDEIIIPYCKKYIKTSWRTSVLTKFAAQTDGDDIIYPLNNSFHYLEYTYLCFKLPAMRIKSKYLGKVRIAWCHDPGNNIRLTSTFKEDDDEYQTIDNVWGDIYPQFYQEGGAGKREGHKLGTGIINYLEDWSEDYLPPYDIDVDQPWSYSNDIAYAYPIWMKGSLTKASHRYTFRKKVISLLRLDLLKNGKWVPQKSNLSKYVDIIGSENIKTPELWGRYGYVSDNELEMYNTCDDTWIIIDEQQKIKQKIYYTRDVISCDIENPLKYKSLSAKTLKCSNPCLAFFWVAENKDATAIHNYSNYTTNTNDVYKGWDPIKKTTFKLGKSVVFNKMDSHHFSIAQPRKHFLSTPWMTGYHGYSNAQDSTDFNGDNGLVYDELLAVMNCRIDNNDIYINRNKTEDNIDDEDDDDDDDKTEIESSSSDYKVSDNKLSDLSSPNFIVRTRLLVVRKFVITNKDGVCTFEII